MPESDALPRVHNQASLERECSAIEQELQALRAAYEQFFLGIERQPPHQAHKDLKRRMNRLRDGEMRNTGAKFRIQALMQRLQTYEQMWARTIEQREAGTYHRDVFKARYRAKKDAAVAKPPEPTPAQTSAPLAAAPAATLKAAPPPPSGPSAAARAAAAKSALNETKLREVYDSYLMAKKRCNEDVSRLSFDAVASTLRKQVPELLKKHNAKDVDFKVIIKDGKAVLKAVPK